VYYGSQFVHVSHDKGKNWSVISPDLTTNRPEQQKRDYGGLTPDASGAEFYNSILALAPSPVKQETIWAGTDDGLVQITRDGGKTWKEVGKNIKGLPAGSWVARIYASGYEEGTAWVVANNYRKGGYRPYLFKTENFGRSWKSMIAEDSPVFGYSLSFIQDPVTPNLVFLGTENGLWISFDQGEHWEQFKNGYPSVSTMDLKIQQRESALVVGTFGRAIWIIDDLQALRTVAANSLKPQLTVAKVNPAVQVKGIFINAPGNIWSGFHTTFQGENRPFREVNIPYFINKPERGQLVTASIMNAENEVIMELVSDQPPVEGLNYLNWRLDETINRLPGSWVNEESRGIPVLPGNYRAVLKYGTHEDMVDIEVIADPRFDFAPEIDKALYKAQKELNDIRQQLNQKLVALSEQKESLAKLIEFLDPSSHQALIQEAEALSKTIDLVRYQALGRPEKRQVGAWQSFEETPVKKIRGAEQKFMSSHTMPSMQELELIEQAGEMVNAFIKQYETHFNQSWLPFKKKVNGQNMDWK
jgi:hypothetical protein